MNFLEKRIQKDGRILSDNTLKVDQFFNHQIDPQLMKKVGQSFADYFKNDQITKILTIESSGIAPALMTGLYLNVPVIFARKHKSVIQKNNIYTANVYSFTKKTNNTISVNKDFINSNDRILMIDDFLANGSAISGMIDIISKANANIGGAGVAIEKKFQKGHQYIQKNGIKFLALASIASLDNGKIAFAHSK
ncbi:xanthine phosphoribosyltransferase [Philodulcilactobacillus myokoensis]|uniref:Xanthine phosphoribosyltransferase n=1 Tax=Philodulcilactobacillus myokoensis TaxID=2929573 RepID=A0A9W6B0A4_9LACO|nr:xanthine phosphoribosyltransferase [Philodulcilactobacillus myokoensis]GLB46639.1 xanthine phosphoribosyltransferase [Philodulcilactobacillus myokoensis]